MARSKILHRLMEGAHTHVAGDGTRVRMVAGDTCYPTDRELGLKSDTHGKRFQPVMRSTPVTEESTDEQDEGAEVELADGDDGDTESGESGEEEATPREQGSGDQPDPVFSSPAAEELAAESNLSLDDIASLVTASGHGGTSFNVADVRKAVRKAATE